MKSLRYMKCPYEVLKIDEMPIVYFFRKDWGALIIVDDRFVRNKEKYCKSKSAFCICENKDADQLRSNYAADQHLCFRNIDSTIPLLPKSEISSL